MGRSAAIGLLLAACGGGTGTGPDGSAVQSIAIASPSGTVVEQQATPLTATVTIRGTPRAAQAGEVTWALVTASDGQITASGQFTPAHPGAIGVRLQLVADPAITATRQIQVDSAAIVSLAIVPLLGIAPGDTVRPQVIGTDAVGRQRVPNGVTLHAMDPVFAAVPGGTAFRATAAGQGTLRATLGALTASLAVAVAPPYARLAVTPIDPQVDWARGARVQVQGITVQGAAVPLASAVTIAQVGGEPGLLGTALVDASTLRLRTLLPPFQGNLRRDVGVTVRVAVQYRGLEDTLTLPVHYRRPQAVSWSLAAGGPRTIAVGESFSLGETVLQDSVGAAVPLEEAYGTLSGVSSTNTAVVSLSPARVVTALASGSSSVQQSYAEPERATILLTTTVTVAPPAPDVTPIGTGYLKVVAFSGLRSAERAALVAAVARLETVIAGSTVASQPVTLGAGACAIGSPAISETVTGILVQVGVRSIDGRGGAAASASLCLVRAAPDRRPAVGTLTLDDADLAGLSGAMLQDVFTHELLHLLGIGTLWDVPSYNFVPTPLGSDPRYSGTAGNASYVLVGGFGLAPVENVGGAGAAGSHWRESVFRSELMSSVLSGLGANPISRVTIGALADLGYVVNYARAESYTLGQALRELIAEGSAAPEFVDAVGVQPTFVVGAAGQVVRGQSRTRLLH